MTSFMSHPGSSASNQQIWSCSSLICLFLAGFCSFVHSPPIFLLWCIRTTVKITKQILVNHLLIYHNSSHLTTESLPANPLTLLHFIGHVSGRKVEICLVKWLNSSVATWRRHFNTVQYSTEVLPSSHGRSWASCVCCLSPRRMKDLKSSKLLAYARHFPQQCLLVW